MVEFITQYGQENPVDDFQRFLKLMENSSFPMPIIKKDISGIIIKGLIDQNSINKEKRIFSGFGSVAIIDRQGDYLPIEEFKPVMEKLMQRGAPVTDSHSNHVVGKIVDYTYKPTPTGEMGLYLTAEIYNHYPTDAETWRKIQEGEYTGFSLGGKAGTKTPTCTNIGCYNILGNIEAWEFSIVERPANQLANIDKVNKLAKASDIIEEVVYSITKERVYIKTPADAPKDKKVQEGERGGLYYESEASSQRLSSKQPETKKPQQRRIKANMSNRYKLAAIGEKKVLEKLGGTCCINANKEIQWNSPVDYIDYIQKIAYEVKTFSKESKDIKVKTNPEIKNRKEKWAVDNNYILKTIVVIYDKRNNITEGYIKDGYGGFRPSNMERIW